MADGGSSAWELVSLGLGIGSSGVAVAGAGWGVWLLGRRAWDRTVGRRRAQAEILNQLACTISLDYLETLLGTPRYITHADGPAGPGTIDERLYRLPGAWVAIQAEADSVYLFSLTITDSNMWHHVGAVSLGVADLRLGKDSFVHANNEYDGQELWMGARHCGYIRHYYHANPGGFQHYWLSYNGAGSGAIDMASGPYASGIYGQHGDTPPNPASITANTLTILGAGHDIERVANRQMFGPHAEHLRLIPAERKRLGW